MASGLVQTALDAEALSCFFTLMSNVYYLDDYRPGAEAPFEPEKNPSSRVETEIRRRKKLKLNRSNRVEEEVKRFAKPERDRLLEIKRAQEEEARATNYLELATPVILYHVYWGRNAWHSTWVARYQRNTLAVSRREAEAFIGERLKQGTAFRLTVMPGWHLKFRDSSFLVAEINTHTPFARLLDPKFARRMTLQKDALELLKPDAKIWDGPVPDHDNVIVQETNRPAEEFEAWSSKTELPQQVRTPGAYRREIDGARWWMEAINGSGPIDYDFSAFERALRQLEA
ncbi:hypothetical protein P8R33_03800 [Qipengyuania sp. XHP0211]|uniref:hypothetical protein n=1 Tax=Qipengyuania sp. XHP0211 TaxID=3038079 RepID=UPI00241E8BE2|nr:hypothetical protein [Qipengyuania sp. XHP0211]MDG5750223.1 hypothetical protein [Qipengyuania sp. XHP0211]